jgi:hypothetical protein
VKFSGKPHEIHFGYVIHLSGIMFAAADVSKNLTVEKVEKGYLQSYLSTKSTMKLTVVFEY